MITIEELQTILESEAELEVEIQSDGSIIAVNKGTAQNKTLDKSKFLSLEDLSLLKDSY